MSSEIEQFHQEFFQDVHGSADASGQYAEDAFFDLFCSQLIDAGELETADRAPYASARGIRVDGYGGDPAGSDGVLSLIIADFNQSGSIATLTASDMDATFKRLSNFLGKALDPSFRTSAEEASPGFGLADLISRRWPSVTKVRMFLISNRVLSARVDGREAGEFRGVQVTYSVWDLARLHRFAATGRGREEISIDLEKDFGGALAALPAHLTNAGYESYLVVVPGAQLAKIYDRWGARLLEQNVRVFLQARGSVNKGIKTTLESTPEMFFAYNNGITATAEHVTATGSSEGLRIRELRNLQIVNGGQTTASIHAASRRKDVDLSNVFVQMKLSIVQPEQAMDIVPKISEFANSQNRVNAADFFANHPFHVLMQKCSRRVFAPSPDGTFRESKWFYERARGQYQDERALLTEAQRRKFDLEYPKRQLISKTDFAKYLNLWKGHPDIVSKGAQKNFVHFANATGKEWAKNQDAFNDRFFRHGVAKAIIFRETERLVTEQPWYEGGYRANVVAYAIAKIGYEADRIGRAVDFDGIWRAQGITDACREALVVVSKEVRDVIVAPEAMGNVTEWAKQQACWNRVQELKISFPRAFERELVSESAQRDDQKDAVKDQQMVNGIEAQTLVVKAGGPFWKEVRQWGAAKGMLTPSEAGILDVASFVPSRIPSEKQCIVAVGVLRKLQGEGCRLGQNLSVAAD